MPMPERITGDMPGRVRVSAPGKYHGQEGNVEMVYYDRLHTGSSYDELTVTLDSGEQLRGAASLFEAAELPSAFISND